LGDGSVDVRRLVDELTDVTPAGKLSGDPAAREVFEYGQGCPNPP
jgi:hypothetical protein